MHISSSIKPLQNVAKSTARVLARAKSSFTRHKKVFERNWLQQTSPAKACTIKFYDNFSRKILIFSNYVLLWPFIFPFKYGWIQYLLWEADKFIAVTWFQCEKSFTAKSCQLFFALFVLCVCSASTHAALPLQTHCLIERNKFILMPFRGGFGNEAGPEIIFNRKKKRFCGDVKGERLKGWMLPHYRTLTHVLNDAFQCGVIHVVQAKQLVGRAEIKILAFVLWFSLWRFTSRWTSKLPFS